MMKPSVALLLALALTGACATTTNARARPATPTQRPVVRGEEFRVVSSPTTGAGDAYDAAMLFERATRAVREQRCEEAVALYERLVREFPDNLRVPTSQYNRGLCLQRMERLPDAVDAMRAAATAPREPDLTRDAWFRVAVMGERAQRPGWVIEASDALLGRADLPISERIEALARRAVALLAQNDPDGAERAAEQAIALAPTSENLASIGDDTYAAQARVALAEVFRTRANDVVYRVEDAAGEEAITRRVQIVTHAHVLFNDAIRVGNPHWAAAAGFRIGEMYRDLYRAIVDAPTPAEWDAPAREIYRRRTGDRLRPLLQGALRSWEATLTMARRNAISDNEWVRRATSAIDDLRALIVGGGNTTPVRRPAPAAPTGAPAPTTSRPAT
jgi:tetratricopeptide (TPR) repeat protein